MFPPILMEAPVTIPGLQAGDLGINIPSVGL